MSKHKKRKKQYYRRPSLHALDKVTYCLLFCLILLFWFGLERLFMWLRTSIASQMGAVAIGETLDSLWLILPSIVTLSIMFIWLFNRYEKRIPIFEKHEKVERKRRIVKIKDRIFFKKVITVAIAVYLIMWVFAIGSIWSRTDVTQSHVNCYTLFGWPIRSYPIENAQAVEVRIFYDTGIHSSSGWRMSYTVIFEDRRSYTFEYNPSTIVEIDALFYDVKKTVYGAQKFEKLCEEYHLDEVERAAAAQVCMIPSE